MPKSTTSKTTTKSTHPRRAIRRTVASASELVETMLEAIQAEVKTPKAKRTTARIDRMFGPRGAIANLHKLMQVLDKLSEQLDHVEDSQTNKKASEMAEPLSKDDIKLLEEWLQQQKTP